tara:strand:- start:1002 stop:1391 length:390 start_codon:yes stop_codon:yes gene_type:complete
MATAKSKANINNFDLSKYQVQAETKPVTVKIAGTDDEFEITVRQLSWSKRNQLISKSLEISKNGQTKFNGDLYVRESLKEMIVDAPWGATTEVFLASIDERLGTALESVVPSAYGTGNEALGVDNIKKE